jgi:hypothetical protein
MAVAEPIDREVHLGPAPVALVQAPTLRTRTFVLVAAALVALHLAKAGLFLSAGQPPLYLDALGYWQLGAQMAAGDPCLRIDPGAYRTPGYPAFLALCQVAFGADAMIAAAAVQQLAIVAIALITGLICGRLSGSRVGVLAGLAVSLFCISRNCIAAYLLSDTLFCLTLAILFLGLVAWFDRPTRRWAAVIGLLLGVGILLKPSVQLLWVPLLAAMALRLYQQKSLRSLGVHGTCLVLAMAALVGPWCLRNQLLFGRPFLTRSLGRQLWDASLSGEISRNPLCPMPLDFSDGPKSVQVLEKAQAHDVDPHETFRVYDVLRQSGYSELEADALMESVTLEAIRQQPLRFAKTRAYWSLLFWITPAELLRWEAGNTQRGEFSVGEHLPPNVGCSYMDQQTWCSPRLAAWQQVFMQCCWWPSRWLYAAAAIATFWSGITLLRNPERRMLVVALGLVLLYFTVTTALFAPPVYRYRMVLEPLMIAIVVSGLLETALAQRICRRWITA